MKKVKVSRRKKSCIIQNFEKLQNFTKACPKQRIFILKISNHNLTRAFYEGRDNIIKTKYLLSKSQIKNLKPHADKIRFFCNPKLSLKANKKFLHKPKFLQEGYFIGTLLATLLPIPSLVIDIALNRMVCSKNRERKNTRHG